MKSESLKNLAVALTKVQASLKPAAKDRENLYFKSKYSDLNAVWDSVRELLSLNGLSVIQSGVSKDGHFFLETTLLHTSGEWISGEYLVKAQKEGPQDYGSAWTYARRYSLAAIVGVISDDDDGESATKHTAHESADRTVTEFEVKKTVQKAVNRDNDEKQEFSFIPVTVSSKQWSKGDKSGTAFSIKSTDGTWFSTLDEKVADQAIQAKEESRPFEGKFVIRNGYKNITEGNIAVPF